MTFGLVPFPAASDRRSPRSVVAEHEPPRIKAICLDIDDTLVDFTSSARRALYDLIGRDDMWPCWQRTTDEHVARVVAGELSYANMHTARTKAFFADLGALLDDDLVARLEERRCTQLRTTWQLFDDAIPCLDWLRAAGFKLAAVTNASGNHQRAKLAGLGIARFFDTLVIAGELGAAKPDPVIFHTACARMGVRPSETVHVGDLLDTDAVGARDAGLHGVWLARSSARATAEPGVQTIESLSDLPELLVSEYRTPDVTATTGADFRCREGVV
jgi:putative hydrolase of the HAD superfamily